MSPILSHLIVGVSCFLLGTAIGWFLKLKFLKDRHSSIVSKKWNIVLGIGVTVLAIVSLVGMLVGIQNYAHATNCQSNYNKIFADVVIAREYAADLDRDNQKKLNKSTLSMLKVILDQAASQQQKLDAILGWQKASQDYDSALSEADKTRGQNPLHISSECAIK